MSKYTKGAGRETRRKRRRPRSRQAVIREAERQQHGHGANIARDYDKLKSVVELQYRQLRMGERLALPAAKSDAHLITRATRDSWKPRLSVDTVRELMSQAGESVAVRRGGLAQPAHIDWPYTGESVPTLFPTPGWNIYGEKGQTGLRNVGFNALGLDSADLDEQLERIEQRQRLTRDFCPIFLTNNPSFAEFRRRQFVFEYLPIVIVEPDSEDESFEPKWLCYFRGRLDILVSKWGITSIVEL